MLSAMCNCHGGFHSYLRGYFHLPKFVIWHMLHCVLCLLETVCSVIVLAATSRRKGKFDAVCCGDQGPRCSVGRFLPEIIFFLF